MQPPSTLIIAAKSGQLGNRLFTSANYMAFALEHGYWLLNPSFDDYAPHFEGTRNNLLGAFPALPIQVPSNSWMRHRCYELNRTLCKSGKFNVINIERGKAFSLRDESFQIQIRKNSLNFIQGWLFREGWFIEDRDLLAQYSPVIKDYFQPLGRYRKTISQFMATLRRDYAIVIGMHVRQGDYQAFKAGRYFYESDRYFELIKSLNEQLNNANVCFVICSNVEQDLEPLRGLNVCAGIGGLVEDMYLLAECDYIIGPPSSYSMWASFYGDKPLYMLRDVEVVPRLDDFVSFYDWKGRFNAHEDWSKNTWDWLSQPELLRA
jgi:hypothetical protein